LKNNKEIPSSAMSRYYSPHESPDFGTVYASIKVRLNMEQNDSFTLRLLFGVGVCNNLTPGSLTKLCEK